MIASFLKSIGKAQACYWWADGRPLLIGYICIGVHTSFRTLRKVCSMVLVYRTSSHCRERMVSVWGLGGLHYM